MDESDLMSVVLGCFGEQQEAQKRAPPSSDPLAFLAPPPPSPSPPFFSMAEMESLATAVFDLPDLSTMSGGTYGGLEDLLPPPPPPPQPQPSLQLQKEQQQQQQEGFFVPSVPSSTVGGFVHRTAVTVTEPPQPPPPRRLQAAAAARAKKRKKNQHKKVNIQLSPDFSGPNDNWAWRKYGQKPIKGSPYPRGYYRCSTEKSCPARKHVEKSWTNQGMYIITYSEEHIHPLPTHRNSLAGSIRNKHSTSSSGSRKGGAGGHQHSSSLSGLSPTTPLTTSRFMDQEDGEEEEEEGMLRVEDMEIAGEDELIFLANGPNASSSATSMEAMAKAAESALLDGEEDPFFSELWNNTSYNGW